MQRKANFDPKITYITNKLNNHTSDSLVNKHDGSFLCMHAGKNRSVSIPFHFTTILSINFIKGLPVFLQISLNRIVSEILQSFVQIRILLLY